MQSLQKTCSSLHSIGSAAGTVTCLQMAQVYSANSSFSRVVADGPDVIKRDNGSALPLVGVRFSEPFDICDAADADGCAGGRQGPSMDCAWGFGGGARAPCKAAAFLIVGGIGGLNFICFVEFSARTRDDTMGTIAADGTGIEDVGSCTAGTVGIATTDGNGVEAVGSHSSGMVGVIAAD